MRRKTEIRLTPRERLSRGLRYSAIGPVDVTRGAIGVGAQSARATATQVRRRFQEAREAAAEWDALDERGPVQQAVAAVPQVIQEVRASHRRHRRLWVFGALGVLSVVGGAIAFRTIRHSSQPGSHGEQSTLAPTVEVSPRP